jgi:sec-independent protein translocase protein TatA
MPFGLSTSHLLLVAVIALLVFGAKRLPEIGNSVGKAIREFRRSLRDVGRNIVENSEHRALPEDGAPRRDERSRKLSE